MRPRLSKLKTIPKKSLAIILLTILPLAGWVGVAQAHGFRSGNNIGVAAGETVDGTLFVSGRTIDIAGTVNGDVFCAGQNISVTGTVRGDVICAGQTVRVSGAIEGDVRVAGQTIGYGGTANGNLTAAGQTVSTEGGSSVGGDASLAGTDLTVNGEVGRDIAFGSDSATLNGIIGRNVIGDTDRLSLGSNSRVTGDITYTSRNDLTRNGGAEVTGEIRRQQPEATRHREGERPGIPWLFILAGIVSMLLLALGVVALMPRILQRSSSAVIRSPGKIFLTGLATSLLAPVLIAVLMFTLVGIPLGLLALLAWLVIMILSGPFAAYAVGRYLLRGKSDNAIWIMLAGAALLIVLYLVPILNVLVVLAAYWFGIGMIIWLLLRRTKPDYQVDNGAQSKIQTT